MISVCIATYNGEKYIKKQIESILHQLTKDDEVIISDDNSTDNTLSEIKSINDQRIKIINFIRDKSKLNRHILVSSNFENAFKHAKGEYIFLSDQDDLWAPNKITEFMKYLGAFDLVISDCSFIISDDIKQNTSLYNGKPPFRNLLLKKPQYHGCCIAVTKKIIDIAIPFPEKLPTHDVWLGLISECLGKTKFIDKKLTYYRLHDSSVSQTTTNSFFYKISYRINIYANLIKRVFCYKFKK